MSEIENINLMIVDTGVSCILQINNTRIHSFATVIRQSGGSSESGHWIVGKAKLLKPIDTYKIYNGDESYDERKYLFNEYGVTASLDLKIKISDILNLQIEYEFAKDLADSEAEQHPG